MTEVAGLVLPELHPNGWTQECLIFPGGVYECPATLGDSDGPVDGDLRPLAGQCLVPEGTSPGRPPPSQEETHPLAEGTRRKRSCSHKKGDTCALQLTGYPVRQAFHHTDGIQLIGFPIRWDVAGLGDD